MTEPLAPASARPFGRRPAERGRSRGRPSGGSLVATATVLLVVATAPLADVAAGASLLGGTPTLSSYVWSTGCASAKAPSPTWTPGSGHGRFGATVGARTCSAARGGPKVYSEAYTSSSISLQLPLRLPSGRGGVNVSWNVSATSLTRASVTSYACPLAYANSSTNYGYTWYNFSDAYYNCYSLAFVEVFGYAYLQDLTGNTTLYGAFYWLLYNTSGTQNYSATYTANYSNASYWTYNYTLAYAPVNYSYGSPGILTGNWAPTWFLNGTFVHAHRYLLTTYVGVYAFAAVLGFRGTAFASLNAASLGRGAGLSVHSW